MARCMQRWQCHCILQIEYILSFSIIQVGGGRCVSDIVPTMFGFVGAHLQMSVFPFSTPGKQCISKVDHADGRMHGRKVLNMCRMTTL